MKCTGSFHFCKKHYKSLYHYAIESLGTSIPGYQRIGGHGIAQFAVPFHSQYHFIRSNPSPFPLPPWGEGGYIVGEWRGALSVLRKALCEIDFVQEI